MAINWNTTAEDSALIEKIIDRATALGLVADRMAAVMDVTAAHANGCPLKLADLLASPDFDFTHDIIGISRHISRTTGRLLHCFLPRYAA